MGARVVQRHVMNRIKDDRLRVYVVWSPIRDGDNEAAARDAMQYLVDPRVRHFWVKDLFLSESLKKPLRLQKDFAWDVYLLYPPKATWSDSLPAPLLGMQLDREEMPAGTTLNGLKLAEEIQKLLAAAPRRR